MELWILSVLAVGGVLAFLRPGSVHHESVKRRGTTVAVPVTDLGGPVDLYLTNIAADANRVALIKAIREHTGLGLKEAKDKVDNAPILLVQNMSEMRAAHFEQALAQSGAITSRRGGARPASDVQNDDFVEVELTVVGGNPIQVIRVVREFTHMGLSEAKGLVEAAPMVVCEGIPRAQAERMRAQFTAVGATVKLR
ncbi:MAG TPA: ribosomal protein L7/L12 [Candidatus Xenobia bacterium]|jgi:large subunit ribosomal protein L7/L12